MTSISTVGHADVGAVPKVKSRNLSLDRARTFLTLVVLLHHAVIPYTYFGHTDPKYFFGFDMIVLATDSFFMAMFFFLSGLFAWSGIARKGPLNYLSDRLLRIALPFAICAFTVIPLAYYAISLRHHPEIGFSAFWWNMVTKGPWPSGRSGFSGFCSRSIWSPACSTNCRPTCSIRSTAFRYTAAAAPRRSSRSCWPSLPRSTFPD